MLFLRRPLRPQIKPPNYSIMACAERNRELTWYILKPATGTRALRNYETNKTKNKLHSQPKPKQQKQIQPKQNPTKSHNQNKAKNQKPQTKRGTINKTRYDKKPPKSTKTLISQSQPTNQQKLKQKNEMPIDKKKKSRNKNDKKNLLEKKICKT